MIISRARNYIFVHIPKTGGTAMALALEARAAADDILIGDTPKAVRRRGRLNGLTPTGRLWKHSTLADIDGVVGRDELAGIFTFTLVRNPWDRIVSYYHWLRGQGFDHPAVALAKRLDFAGFVMDPATAQSFVRHPFASYLTDAAGVERAGAYVRLEHLEADLAPVTAHLGFAVVMPVVNTSGRVRNWRGYYTDATAAQVGLICAADIARFGYGFDGR